MLSLCSLSSGSKGNCIYIASDTTEILVDFGMSYAYVQDALQKIGTDVKNISGVVVTHEHADHVCGLLRASQEGLKVYAHARTTLAINAKCGRIQTENLPFYDGGFAIGDITVLPFRVPHDAVYPLAYSFIEGGDKISVATDIGHPTEGIINNLKTSRILLLEANHDREMLLGGDYPDRLKKRIDGANGHLSNETAAEILKKVISPKTKQIVLGHLSENNNTPELAFQTIVDSLSREGIVEGRDVLVDVATQSHLTRIF